MIELESITNGYFWIKTFHVIGAAVLLGTGFGNAFFKLWADRTGDVHAIAFTSKTVVLVDRIFTAPAVVLQLVTGLAMVRMGHHSFTEAWLALAIGFFLLTGFCWLPAVYIQMRCRDLAVQASHTGATLSDEYRRLSRIWFWLGVVGFTSVWILVGLMVMRPAWAS
jgi:uncharacterized membrane protein